MRTLVIAAMLALPGVAHAAGEPVRLVVDAPCLAEDELVADVARLGTSPILADEAERARRFVVTITAEEGGRFDTHLRVRDLVGRETTRAVKSPSCIEARRAAALLVSMVLDEEDDPAPITGTPQPFPWPEPAAPPLTNEGRPIPPARVGSGGVSVGSVFDMNAGYPGDETLGLRVAAVWRLQSVRVGGALAYQHERREELSWTDLSNLKVKGTNGRAGLVLAVGAPWNDSVVGFALEGGLEVGDSKRRVTSASGGRVLSASSKDYASPRIATSLLLQVPWRSPFRPVAGFTAGCTPIAPDRKIALAGELGLVWQAW